jgi:ankyrin repeat protein
MFLIILVLLGCTNLSASQVEQKHLVQGIELRQEQQDKLLEDLWLAIGNDHYEEFVKIYQENSIDNINTIIDVNGHTLLTHAIECKHFSIIDFLIENDVDLNTIQSNIGTPLIFAIWCLPVVKSIELLISSGADPLLSKPQISHLDPINQRFVEAGNVYHFVRLYRDKERPLFLEAIAKGKLEYAKRLNYYAEHYYPLYKETVKKCMTEHLGISDLATICLDYTLVPYHPKPFKRMTLPASIMPAEAVEKKNQEIESEKNRWCVIN